MFGSVKKSKISKNEKKLEKIHGNRYLYCTNEHCHNKVRVTEEEVGRIYQCTKCMSGYLKK